MYTYADGVYESLRARPTGYYRTWRTRNEKKEGSGNDERGARNIVATPSIVSEVTKEGNRLHWPNENYSHTEQRREKQESRNVSRET